jgi:DICT domain-containing protein
MILHDEQQPAIATSPLQDVERSLLMVNSDLYVTGTRSLSEVHTPEVVVNLDEVTFSVAGKRKFLLIHISRHVEAMAHETAGGVLHTGFQKLSRITDERGTAEAYRQIVDRGVDVHVYGSGDWGAPTDLDVTVHAHETGEITDSWFVVYDGDGDDDRKAALVAVETGDNEYRGFWTFETDLVDDVIAYIDRTYLG